jgi:hypothetical protein
MLPGLTPFLLGGEPLSVFIQAENWGGVPGNYVAALTPIVNGGFPPYSYSWTASAGVTVDNPTLGTGNNARSASNADATVFLTVTDSTGQPASASAPVTI